MPLSVRARVVDIRTDTPRESDTFLVDTNAWYWLFYTRASLSPDPLDAARLADYSSFLKSAIGAGSTLLCAGLTFSELAHNIERAELKIYETQANKTISPKVFRHDYPMQRQRLVKLISEVWDDVLCVSTMTDLNLDSRFMESALQIFPSVGLDGYDLFMAEAALQAKTTNIVTDDGDFATVPGLTIFTANPRVIQSAEQARKLLVR